MHSELLDIIRVACDIYDSGIQIPIKTKKATAIQAALVLMSVAAGRVTPRLFMGHQLEGLCTGASLYC